MLLCVQIENSRRRFNFIPFIVQLFKELAAQKALLPLVDAAKTRAEALRQQRIARKAATSATGGTAMSDDDDDEEDDD